jgi:hypothetical protein
MSTIRISTQLWASRMSDTELVERARAYGDMGVDLGIVSLPRPLNVADIHRYAEVLS